jgi:Ni/Co efflux regulator RcnB
MRSKAFVAALVTLALASGGTAFGQGNSGHQNGPRNDRSQRDAPPDWRGDAGPSSDRGQDRPRERGYGPQQARGAGPNHAFVKGGRLPHAYRQRQYVVDDWRGHNLSAPPRGYHWVQTGGDYVLVAIATGIILQLLLAH